MTPTFEPFPKIPRLFRDCIITEKIDGTNATIAIMSHEQACILTPDEDRPPEEIHHWEVDGIKHVMFAGSRTRWITPQNDNHGFARWVFENAKELAMLGPGVHRGEWWGCGIQRGYGLKEKRLSLFNVSRWHLRGAMPSRIPSADPRIEKYTEELPPCVGLVPVLYQGPFCTVAVSRSLDFLSNHGSQAAMDYMKPEGVVVFHTAANTGFKVTLENDNEPKSKA